MVTAKAMSVPLKEQGNVNKVQATMYKKVLRKKVQRMADPGLKDIEKQIRFGNCFLSRFIYGFEIS